MKEYTVRAHEIGTEGYAVIPVKIRHFCKCCKKTNEIEINKVEEVTIKYINPTIGQTMHGNETWYGGEEHDGGDTVEFPESQFFLLKEMADDLCSDLNNEP
jgi:hypothetical protein